MLCYNAHVWTREKTRLSKLNHNGIKLHKHTLFKKTSHGVWAKVGCWTAVTCRIRVTSQQEILGLFGTCWPLMAMFVISRSAVLLSTSDISLIWAKLLEMLSAIHSSVLHKQSMQLKPITYGTLGIGILCACFSTFLQPKSLEAEVWTSNCGEWKH